VTSRVVIFGGEGIGLIIAETIAALAARGEDVVSFGFLNDATDVGRAIGGIPVLGRFEDWPNVAGDACFIAAFPKAKHAKIRHQRLRELGVPAGRWRTVIHPTAQVARAARIDRGCYLGSNAVVEPGAGIDSHTIVRAGAYVSHDVRLGAFCAVGPNATLLGASRLGDGVHVGANAVVVDHLTVGEYVVIGVGSVVVRDVAPFSVVAGNPARVIGNVEQLR
jgi:sugar O-acyltransferase (sialic acid O-acetyltransferase NeuD family)